MPQIWWVHVVVILSAKCRLVIVDRLTEVTHTLNCVVLPVPHVPFPPLPPLPPPSPLSASSPPLPPPSSSPPLAQADNEFRTHYGYIVYFVVQVIWEVIPTYLIVFFFRVTFPSSSAVSLNYKDLITTNVLEHGSIHVLYWYTVYVMDQCFTQQSMDCLHVELLQRISLAFEFSVLRTELRFA